MKTNLRRILYIMSIISVIMLMSAFTAFAAEVEDGAGESTEIEVEYSPNAVAKGNCGDESYVYWEVVPNEDGTEEDPKYTMNIFGEGDTFKNIAEDGTNVGYGSYEKTQWNTYRPNITRVYVGDNITTLGNYSFVRNNALKIIEMGVNVKNLSTGAFEGCTALTTIYRKGNTPVEGTFDLTGMASFGGYLFDGCKKVKNIIFPNDVEYGLNTEFLKSNTALETLYIPASCTKISPIAFRDCTALKNIYFEGDTIILEGEITKGKEGTFYAYGFHNCGVKSGDIRTFTISALNGSPAHEYALKNASYTITTTKTTTNTETNETTTTTTTANYGIEYLAPPIIDVYDNGEKLVELEVVEGFPFDHEYNIGNAVYIFYEDETYSALRESKPISNGESLHGKRLLNFLGYMVRVEDHHGLRAMFEYNTSAFADVNGYTVLEAGVLGGRKYGIDAVLDLDFKHANKTVIYSGNVCTGKLISYTDRIATFAHVAVGFEDDNGILSKMRVADDIMNRAFVTVQNNETGETTTYYSVQTMKDISSACKATIEAGADILNSDQLSFVNDLVSLKADENDFIYSKEQALEYLNTIYNDADHILSGQHISSSKNTVKESLNKLYAATGELPAVLSYDVSVAYRDSDYDDEYTLTVAEDFTEYAKQGGLISMCAHMTNPDPEADDSDLANGLYRGSLDTIEKWDQLFVEGNIINTNFMTELSAIADFLQLLEDRGVPIFWRPYHETNGAWFWFCGARVPKKITHTVVIPGLWEYDTEEDVSAEYFTKLWQFTYNYLVTERGLDNLIWIYSPNIAKDGSTSSKQDIMKYYPGDDYVDVMGIDWYTGKDITIGETPELLDAEHSTVWSRLAGTYTKTDYVSTTKKMPVVYGEFGPGSTLRNADPTLSYNGETALQLVKDVAATGRNMGWIVFWSGWTNNPISLDLMYKGDVFMNDEFVYDLAESRKLLFDAYYE